ncbi:MAG TPA: pre-peptidase C-terminal domain-containing protein [bacterium]|nr:pre-peptidase C-terminal domain-containing protein [bacterium]
MKKYLILLAFFLPFVVSAANTPQITNVTNSSRIYRMSVNLTAGTNYVFRTYGTTSSIDTVLYLLNSSNSQIAYNDDCGSNCVSPQTSLNSTISFTPSASGYYYIVMRNYYSGRVGVEANLKIFTNGNPGTMMTGLPLGGTRTSIPAWDAFYQSSPIVSWRKLHYYYFNSDREAAGGATANDTVMYLMSGNSITNYDDDSGAGWTSKITKTSGSCSSGCYILSGAYPASYSYSEGNARLIVDVDTRFGDSDFDGLSDGLETILGTSSALFDGGDTDEDGLSDFIETLGSDNVQLPWEGASPTQKDIFMEIDYMPVDPSYSNPVYSDYFPAMRNYFISNDNLDILVEMGYSFVQHADAKVHVEIDDQVPFSKNLNCDDEELGDDPVNTDQLASYFTSTRSGIYRWVIFGDTIGNTALNASGWSCSNGTMIVGLQQPSITKGEENIYVLVHELGHNLSLGHNGNNRENGCHDDNSKIHRSVMNYHWLWYGMVPRINSADSYWRYSTDVEGSYSNPVENWDLEEYDSGWYMVWNSSGGCAQTAEKSPKHTCVGLTGTTNCDCTQNDYTSGNLDFSGAGRIMGAAMMSIVEEETAEMSAEERENYFYEEVPVIGIAGQVIARNINELRESGEKYNKISASKEVKKERKDIKEIFGKKVVERYNELLKEKMKAKGKKEGRDFNVDETGKVEFEGYKYGYQEK